MDHTALTSLEEFLEVPFDYVIVGGGTGGLVLAARLTEDPEVTVGVLEAGKLRLGDQNVESMGGIGHMLHNPEYDWRFKTVPQVPLCALSFNGPLLTFCRPPEI